MWHAADLNYDGADEFILKVPQKGAVCAIRLYASDLNVIFFQKNFPKRITSINTCDWDHKGFKEILLIEQDRHWINLLLLDAVNEEDTLAFMPLVSVDQFGPNIIARYPVFWDINQDGYEDVILSIGSGLQPKLRAVWAVDLKNQNILWKYALATHVNPTMELKLFLSEKHPYLLIPTLSPANGYSANGMDDSHSYALVLDAVSGKCLFRKELGAALSNTRTYYLYNYASAREDLLTITCNQSFQEWDKGKIIIWDWQTQTIRKRLSNFRYQEWIHIADVNNDGTNEVIRSGLDNRILIYDANLIPIDTLIFSFSKITVKKIIDFNKDGFLEYIVSVDPNQTLVVNNSGEILAQADFSGEVSTVHLGVDRPLGLLIFNPKEKLLSVFTLRRNWIPAQNSARFFLVGAIAGSLLFIIVLTFLYLKTKKKSLLKANIPVLENLSLAALITNKNGKIVFCNGEMEKTIGIKKSQILFHPLSELFSMYQISLDFNQFCTPSQLSDQSFTIEVKKGKKTRTVVLRVNKIWEKGVFLGFLVTVEDITYKTHYQQSISWASMAQRLAHEIKNPLTTVKLSLQRLKMEYENEMDKKREKYDLYVDSILEEVIRLRKVAENFMKLCRVEPLDLKPVQINKLIDQIVQKYRQVLPDSLSLKFIPEKNIPEIMGDNDQLETLLSNLLDNAINATEQKGNIEIRTILNQNIHSEGVNETIVLQIEDDGKGIPKEKLETIFEPHVKNDEKGSGLGLAIVKKIVNDHKGKIFISSKVRAGTIVTVHFPSL